MSPEAFYQIGLRAGILDEKHKKALGYSGLWLFGFLIYKQDHRGEVNYGHALSYRQISKGSGIPSRSLGRIFPRVVLKNDYFAAVRTRDGYKITDVKKQKKFLEQDSTRTQKGNANGQRGPERKGRSLADEITARNLTGLGL